MDSVTSLHVVVRNVVFVCERFSCVDQTYHRHVNALLLLQGLLNLQNRVRWLEVERLLHACQGLQAFERLRLVKMLRTWSFQEETRVLSAC